MPRVLEVHARLKDQLEKGVLHEEQAHREGDREGKTLAGGRAAAVSAAAAVKPR